MDHARAAALHAARAGEHDDPRKARAHALRAAFHSSFGGLTPAQAAGYAQVKALPFQLKWDVIMRAGEIAGSGCKAAIAASAEATIADRKGLYDTQMKAAIEPGRLFVPARCKPDGADAAFTASCSRFHQNCAARAGLTSSDPRVASLDNVSIKEVMATHKDAICAGTFYPPIGEWDVRGVTDMSMLFANWTTFNRPIGDWDTSSVTDMGDMFASARAFNQPIDTQSGHWDTSSVTNMSHMFEEAVAFNQPIGHWATARVTDMGRMFDGAGAFNQPLQWATAHVNYMHGMFDGAVAFNQPIGNWATGSVTDMSRMFNGAVAFNQPLQWDTARVTDMSRMFNGAVAFNQPLQWATARVASMRGMFNGAVAFNQPIGNWATGSVTDMSRMLNGAVAFNQPLQWATGRVTDMSHVFDHAEAYDNGGEPLVFDTARVRSMVRMFHSALNFKQRATFSDMSSVSDVFQMFTGCHASGGCVTRLVNPNARGLSDQRGRIQAGPVTRGSTKRARDDESEPP
jgi:hypothetical protein